MKSITEFKELAFKKFKVEEKRPFINDPVMYLYSLKWIVPEGKAFPEKEIAKMNLAFDERSCFGRSVKAAVIAETYFPEETFYSGEVYQDLLRTILINRASRQDWNDERYLNDILQYESPHYVITHNEKQFDPIFKYISLKPEDLEHPTVVKYDLWSGLHAGYLISEAFLYG
jgi:hypothetical protein